MRIIGAVFTIVIVVVSALTIITLVGQMLWSVFCPVLGLREMGFWEMLCFSLFWFLMSTSKKDLYGKGGEK